MNWLAGQPVRKQYDRKQEEGKSRHKISSNVNRLHFWSCLCNWEHGIYHSQCENWKTDRKEPRMPDPGLGYRGWNGKSALLCRSIRIEVKYLHQRKYISPSIANYLSLTLYCTESICSIHQVRTLKGVNTSRWSFLSDICLGFAALELEGVGKGELNIVTNKDWIRNLTMHDSIHSECRVRIPNGGCTGRWSPPGRRQAIYHWYVGHQ